MAPLIFEDLVLIGPAGSENNVQGWVGAFRLADGSPVWRFNTVPKPGEPGYETWQNPKGVPMGGGAVWTSFSLDPETGDLYVPVTNPAPDLPVHLRKGDNLYTNSIVCLDVRTGKRRWHRSLVPNDSHDWDVTPREPAHPHERQRRRPPPRGDRRQGRSRSAPSTARRTRCSTRRRSRPSRTRPRPSRPRRRRVCPGVLGGVEWSDPAYHPGTNLLYVPAVDWCSTFAAFEETRYIPGKILHGGERRSRPAGEGAGLGHRDRRLDRRGEVEVPLAAPDGRLGDDHGRQPAADRRADRRLPGPRRADRRASSTASTPAARWAAAS